jgi:type II secretory pathway pseudopilin PulG
MDRFFKDRRRAQSGATLVELLVSVSIIGLALVIVIGTFSNGLLDAAVAKRNTTAQAAMQYELHKISSLPFGNPPYSECFATENTSQPTPPDSTGTCLPGYSLRADVTKTSDINSPTIQWWTVTIVSWPGASRIGEPVSTLKVDR